MDELKREVAKLHNQIEEIKERNRRVEKDKAWETSMTRKLFIAVATYCLVVLFFLLTRQQHPLSNSAIPVLGFLISSFTYDLLKQWWLKKQ